LKLVLPACLAAQIQAQARAAFPRECCGLIEGVIAGDVFEMRALHPARNDAMSSDRFEIAPEDHFSASRAARANGNALIGCYHSHPDGAAEPSVYDRAGAGEENFLWLIAATDGNNCSLGAFIYRASDFTSLA
jgi:proteasome lid subunit RPN8/RPN11